ncbi:hypothetical protein [Proteiniborus sp.]
MKISKVFRDKERIDEIIKEYKPEAIFHADAQLVLEARALGSHFFLNIV